MSREGLAAAIIFSSVFSHRRNSFVWRESVACTDIRTFGVYVIKYMKNNNYIRKVQAGLQSSESADFSVKYILKQ